MPPDGHEKTLEAITIAGEVKGRDRFQPIVQVNWRKAQIFETEALFYWTSNEFQGLLIRNNEPLRVACLTLINALISSPEDLDFRYGRFVETKVEHTFAEFT